MSHISDKSTISFVIPVLNGEKYMAGCLEAIGKEMSAGDEIIVVDNGCTDNTVAIVVRFPEVKLLTYPKATIAAVRNHGARIAKGSLLAFIDCDCLVCPGWRQAAIEVLSDEEIVATGSHLDLPERPSWVEAAWISARRLVATSATYIPSGNFVVKADAFRAVSGFDESMITDEDTDIGARLCRKGGGIINAPQVRAVHLANPKTLGQFIKKEKWHSISILDKVSWQTIDKPMAMTFAFMACCAVALVTALAAFLGQINPLIPVVLVLTVPFITVLYRLYQFGSYRYFFQQIILYLLFYCVRSLTVIESLVGKNSRIRTSLLAAL